MKDPLDINFSDWISRLIHPSKQIEKHGNKLLEFADLRKRFEYYNKYICSLSYPFSIDGLQCFGQYDHFHGIGSFFFKKGIDKNNDPDFDIYLKVRQEEIKRLKKLLDSKYSYNDKLKSFIEGKAGQFRHNELKVKSNDYEKFTANGGGTIPETLFGNNDEINVEPSTSEEINTYNMYLYNYIRELIKYPIQFHRIIEDDYAGFLSTPGLNSFKLQLSKALNKDVTISNELKRIEEKFSVGRILNYGEMSYPYRIDNFLAWQSALLNGLINGKEYDFSRQKLSVHEIKGCFHIEQVFEYYKQLVQLKNGHTEKNIKITLNKSQWQGTHSQKDKLFKALAADSFIDYSLENKNKFLNNEIVKWNATGRDLYYLLEELKSKKIKFLPAAINLTPFIKLNFVDKNESPFKNINQNKSGTYNINVSKKPRQGILIDTILNSLYTP